jgi:hypothetical protein
MDIWILGQNEYSDKMNIRTKWIFGQTFVEQPVCAKRILSDCRFVVTEIRRYYGFATGLPDGLFSSKKSNFG